jgi:DNA-binding XRE family transcriptional regulator
MSWHKLANELRASGLSWRDVANELNARGFKRKNGKPLASGDIYSWRYNRKRALETRMNRTGEYLFKARLRKGLTQAQLAELIGLQFSVYYKVESGQRMLPMDSLDLLCSILDLDRQTIIDAVYADQKDKSKKYVLTQHGDS